MFWVKLLGDCFLVPFKPILLVVAKLVQENGHPDKALCIANIGAGIMRLGTFNCSGRISVLRELALFFLQKNSIFLLPIATCAIEPFCVRIGIRQGLSAIMTASLIFTAAGVPELSDMLRAELKRGMDGEAESREHMEHQVSFCVTLGLRWMNL